MWKKAILLFSGLFVLLLALLCLRALTIHSRQAVMFEDGEGTVCFPGDMMPTFHHVGSAFNMAYDMLPYQNTLTKSEVLGRARDQKWRIVIDHEPEQALVSVTEDHRGRFALESLNKD